MGLSADEETAVKDTWAIVAKDIKGISVKVFLNFFKGFPEYQKLFRGFADVPLDQLEENKRFKAHAFTVVSTINGMVDNLDDPEILTELLLKTGHNHKKRQLKIGDFQNLSDSLLEFFAKAFGDKWTPIAEEGWKKVFALMNETIAKGLASDD